MSDQFLEREKELMKLNESLNNKMTFDLKQPKAANFKTANKLKKATVNKAAKSDVNQAKNRPKEANKLKSDSSNGGDVKKPFANTYSAEMFSEKYELDPKDVIINRNEHTDDTNKSCGENKRSDDEQLSAEKMGQYLVETIEKAIDTKTSPNSATHLSLIPPNIGRKNISSEGIIK